MVEPTPSKIVVLMSSQTSKHDVHSPRVLLARCVNFISQKKGLLFPDPNDPLGNYNVTSRSPVVNKMVNLGGEERFP